MDHLYDELSVLSKAVAFKNLSGATSHVGLSQPQLSRIIGKIESHLKVVLLDRSAKRKSGWTPEAFRIAAMFTKSIRALEKEMHGFLEGTYVQQLKIGALEGVIPIVLPFVDQLYRQFQMKFIDIGIHDIHQLEQLYFEEEFDLLFTSHEPGRKKFKYYYEIGYQSLDKTETSKALHVMSPFEYGAKRSGIKSSGIEKVLVSNSLAVRKMWLEQYEGYGTLPSAVKKQKSKKEDTERVLLLGADTLSLALWEKIMKFF